MAHIQVWVNVSTHSRAEAAASGKYDPLRISRVSTHSRAEAAALYQKYRAAEYEGFNTQPRGGGCSLHKKARKISVLNTVFR